jgi:hypothetical protein
MISFKKTETLTMESPGAWTPRARFLLSHRTSCFSEECAHSQLPALVLDGTGVEPQRVLVITKGSRVPFVSQGSGFLIAFLSIILKQQFVSTCSMPGLWPGPSGSLKERDPV